jgi:UDP-galactopyranose mutase
MSLLDGRDIVCLSHLRWDWVWQRPQHLMSRLARGRRVYFIEEPVVGTQAGASPDGPRPPQWHMRREGAVIVCQPYFPDGIAAFQGPRMDAALRVLLEELVETERIVEPILWFYTPMTLPSTIGIRAALVVYDCMDELSKFRHAPPELPERERALLERADVVFTGGYSLYQIKKNLHPNVHPFPSGVEAEHFAQARDPDLLLSDELGAVPAPRLGYMGVIDERLDLALLDQVARDRPDWSIVMVGPVIKIDEGELPRRPNIYYFGKQPYAELPRFVKGFDVCMMPFALNEATRFISPTKTLEYMAAGRPIISTPIRDVAEPYGDVVLIVRDPQEFKQAVERVLAEDPVQHERRLTRYRDILSRSSWDASAVRMYALMEQAASRRALADTRTGSGALGAAAIRPDR